MSTVNNVWVWAETPASYAALCALGRTLGSKVEAVWVGDAEGAQSVAAQGCDAVLWAEQPQGALFEDGVAAVVAAVAEQKPDLVLCGTTKRLRLASAHVAAACGTRVVNDAVRVWVDDDGCVEAEHMVYGGSAYSIERATCAPAVVLAGESLLMSVEAAEGAAEALVTQLPASAEASGITLVERKPREVESVNLAAARRVVSVGRGLEKQEDLALIEELARALEAEVGCTRPIAEGVNWMARERYIGVSGAMLKPDLFVAVGVSGQVQHMVGATGAKTIVAINKDKHAPAFKQADYGIVGDLYEVVPQLVESLKAGK